MVFIKQKHVGLFGSSADYEKTPPSNRFLEYGLLAGDCCPSSPSA